MTPNDRVSEFEKICQLNNFQRDILVRIITAAVEAERRDWSHALKQAVENQFPNWDDIHEWPASPHVNNICEWLERVRVAWIAKPPR